MRDSVNTSTEDSISILYNTHSELKIELKINIFFVICMFQQNMSKLLKDARNDEGYILHWLKFIHKLDQGGSLWIIVPMSSATLVVPLPRVVDQ